MNKKTEEQRLLFDKIKIENEIKRDMLNNSYYLDWIVRFMNVFPCGFSDYDVCEDEFDNQNLQKLHLFYEIIESYVMHNYVTEFMNKNIFYLKYGEYFLEISKKYCDGNYKYIVLKSSSTYISHFIDYEDVKANKHSESFDITNNIILELTKKIDELYQIGVPISYIKVITDKAISDLQVKKNQCLFIKKKKDNGVYN